MRILITAGPTIEPIDAVRYISNRSTGRMGYTLAEVALESGHEVGLISGPVSLDVPVGVDLCCVETAMQMHSAVHSRIEDYDALIMVAAVCDLKPKKVFEGKKSKTEFGRLLELESNPDILESLRDKKGNRIHVGFAAQTSNLVETGKRKLVAKGLDLIVANRVGVPGSGFGSFTNSAILIFSDGTTRQLDKMTKRKLSEIIVVEVEKFFADFI